MAKPNEKSPWNPIRGLLIRQARDQRPGVDQGIATVLVGRLDDAVQQQLHVPACQQRYGVTMILPIETTKNVKI